MPESEEHLTGLESAMDKRLGDPSDPLLVSVRSGAKFSMPGMMDTVLNLGLNEESLKGLAQQSGDDHRFARDAYRRFIQMFGKIVMDVPGDVFEHALDQAKARKDPNAQDTDLDEEDLNRLIREFLAVYRQYTGSEFPTDPRSSCASRSRPCSRSWNGKRARDYRRQNKISDDLGTAVNVVAMVFGNRGEDSGTGVGFTRPVERREAALRRLPPERAGRGRGGGHPQHAPARQAGGARPDVAGQLLEVMSTLEGHYRDMCDIEFTIEKGKLWILQTRVGKRTAFAEWVMAFDMLGEG